MFMVLSVFHFDFKPISERMRERERESKRERERQILLKNIQSNTAANPRLDIQGLKQFTIRARRVQQRFGIKPQLS